MSNRGKMVSPRGTESAPASPSAAPVSRILIVGAGGFGREVLQWARAAWPDRVARIAGFLSDEPSRLAGHDCSLTIIASPEGFVPEPGDALLLAIGIPAARRRVAEALQLRGATFLTLIHPTAIVAPTAEIGEGAILCPYSIVSDSARVGRCALLNYHASLGHDASVGEYAVLSPYATLGGNAQIAEDVFLGMHASVGPGRRIGARSKISANSCALADAPTDSIIYGVPGRVGPLIR